MSNFKVTIENFEGPIDALLQLIEKRKMPITDISLADITGDYIRFISSLKEDSLANKTHFIYVASTLTLIKSKSLLPTIELMDDEKVDIEQLKKRILTLKEYQDASQLLKAQINNKPNFFYPKTPKKSIEFLPPSEINLDQLKESLYSVLREIPEKAPTKKEASIRIAVHIEEMMASLEKRLTQALKTDFNSFIGSHLTSNQDSKEVRVYKVVGFLAMLELVKNGALQVLQNKNFSNIEIENI
jgi:segregation and condensation protein A